MGFAGFVAGGLVPALGGALRGRNERARMAEEQRRYDTQQARLSAATDWQQQQAREQAQRQAMMDALTRDVQMGGLKNQAEQRTLQLGAQQLQEEQGALNRQNALDVAKIRAEALGGVSGLQQSQLVDGDGLPLVFDKRLGKYVPAEGVGTIPYRNPTEAQMRFGGIVPTVDAAKSELAAMESPDALPALLSRPPIIGNFMTTPLQRLYNNRLRRYMLSVYLVSGQAFPDKEWSRLERTWGYEPGDDEVMLLDKVKARETFVQGLLRMTPPQYRPAGNGAGAPSTDPVDAAYQRWLQQQR